MFDKDSLNLSEEYSFTVRVKDQEKTLAGKLFLSPNKCTLHVMTERQPSKDFYKSDLLYCDSSNRNFILYELEYTGSYTMYHLYDEEQSNIGFYEYKFEVGFILSSTGFLNLDAEITNFEFSAPMLNKWVGHTKTQNNLINNIILDTEITSDELVEFRTYIIDYAQILLHYELTQFHSHDLFSVGTNFPPKLTMSFKNPKSIQELHIEINKIYELMTLFIGSDFKIDMINAHKRGDQFSKTTVYFPTSNRGKEVEYPLLPLGHDLVHSIFGLKELPLNYFNNFYNLPEERRTLFTNYLRYKRMKSDEEKFLGFFRLLEKLTFKSQSYVDGVQLKKILKISRSYLKNRLACEMSVIKNFSTRIEGTNKMKYNTLKCLGDFYDSLPKEITNKLLFQKNDLEKIIKLRNDITHANHYTIEDKLLYKYTTFINSLLFLAFINELEIPYDICIPINLNYVLPHN